MHILQKKEIFTGSNGKNIDPDSFINLFFKISFSAGEIASLRRTCVWWNYLLSSNSVWKNLFQRDFAPSSDRWVLLNTFLDNKNENFWYLEYMNVLHRIPKVVPLPSHLEDERQEEDEEDENELDVSYQDREISERSIDFSYMKLNLQPNENSSYQLHKLAIILSILSANNYSPKTHSKQIEMVKVGVAAESYRSERVKYISLLHLCHAVLYGEEERIFTLEDYNSMEEKESEPQKKKQKRLVVLKKSLDEKENQDQYFLSEMFQVLPQVNPLHEEALEYSNEFTSYYTTDRNLFVDQQPQIGTSPNIEGPFKPFVFYLKVKGMQIANNEYRWKTTEKGWAPGFFNAGFGWFYHLTMESMYDEADQSITVMKATAREVIN